MSAGLLVCALIIFWADLWCGLYLLSRNLNSPRLLMASGGLFSYALAVGCHILSNFTETSLSVTSICWGLLLLSATCAAGTTIHFIIKKEKPPAYLVHSWDQIFSALLPLLALLALGFGLLLFTPINPFDSFYSWVIFYVGIDIFLIGVMLALLDAFEKGEALRPDFFRAFDFAFFTTLIFGAQVAAVMFLVTGPIAPMLLLLMAIITTATILQVFSDQIGTLLDKVAFARFPWLQKPREELRTAATMLPRVKQDFDFEQIDEAEFTRLTRRALSSFGDLPHLASSPLTQLPIIDTRLCKNGTKDDALGRATELKGLLAESISRLKPQNNGDFGTSDEWRYYNALYFPYIAGLKPYSRRTQHVPSDPIAKKALAWFRTYVPERTLYNWQTAATKLVAQDLRASKE